jgi:tetratricopeptide (TPR) repeat protein
VKEANLCFRNCPGDSDTQIAIVLALQQAGRQEEADALYDQAKDLYYSLAKESPDSAPANNLVAWLQSTCRRDLDQALDHARRAAELEPTSTAVLDTLSEVHFARGEFDKALELNEKIRKLAPTDEHHRRNFERFKAAKEQGGAATTRPSPAI